jgi:hypothetical protein
MVESGAEENYVEVAYCHKLSQAEYNALSLETWGLKTEKEHGKELWEMGVFQPPF